MNRGRYAAPRRRRRRSTLKPLLVAMAVVLLIGCVAGGTLAWLTSTTDKVTNTFSTSDINITLAETPNVEYKMIPGWTIAKDPVVTVVDGSEDCWLFVKVEKSANFDSYMSYEIAAGWTKMDNVTGGYDVYYRKVLSTDNTKSFSVLKDDQVSVLTTVTMSDMATAKTTQPTLTFQAAAVQLYKSNNLEFTAAEAYGQFEWPTT